MGKEEVKNGYYEGPHKNQYEGWTDEEIAEDLRRADEENVKLKEWPFI